MSMADEIDALAGEYVIGTLTLAERTAVTARRQREPELDAAIRAWEQRLAPLDLNTPSVPPPGSLWHQVEQRLDAAAAYTAMVDRRGPAQSATAALAVRCRDRNSHRGFTDLVCWIATSIHSAHAAKLCRRFPEG